MLLQPVNCKTLHAVLLVTASEPRAFVIQLPVIFKLGQGAGNFSYLGEPS
jgi:hypothetical protein